MKQEPRDRLHILLLWSLLFLLALPATAGSADAGETPKIKAVYSGNTKTMKYHNARCRYFTCKACTARFSSPEEARRKGYVACKVCGG